MKWFLLVVLILVGVVALAVVTGMLLPKEHTATRAARFRQPPETIWQAITDYEKFPSWHPGVKSIERLPDREGHPAWIEVRGAERLPLEVVESRSPEAGRAGRLVTRIASTKLPFGGTWTQELRSVSEGTELRIIENGEIYNPVFRFMARFVFGYRTTLDDYLGALGRKFGEQVRLED